MHHTEVTATFDNLVTLLKDIYMDPNCELSEEIIERMENYNIVGK